MNLLFIFLISLSSISYAQSRANMCVGDYNATTWTDCFGSRSMQNGDHYIGNYKNGKANGMGAFTNADGTKYIGEYSQGKRNGNGIEYESNGVISKKGNWIDGVFQKPNNDSSVTVKARESSKNDEVEGKILVTNPKAPPIHTNGDGFRYWGCKGFVNQVLLDRVHKDLILISDDLNIKKPNKNLCTYEIGTMEIFNRKVTSYSVNMYVNEQSMNNCMYRDNCLDFRKGTIIIKSKEDKNIYRQYMLTSVNEGLNQPYMMCFDSNGPIGENCFYLSK